MATITSNIKIIENLTGTFTKITSRIEKTVNAFENMGRASKLAANTQELDKTRNKMEQITNNINKMSNQQKQFSNEIENSSRATENLLGKFKNIAQTIGGLFIGKKIADFVKSSLDSMATQNNAELQLGVTLGNMGAASDAFDKLTQKAASIQTKGIFGDEAMISAAAELATYMTDVSAIEKMMDTLSNYAIGMSNGQAVDPQQMINYATNLGKVTIGSYEAMTKKGFEFTESQKAILEGTATQAQLIEVLGNRYMDLSQDMQKAETIAQVIESSWGNLYETMSNTPTGKITQFKNALGDIQEQIGARLSQSVVTLFDTINKNMPFIQNVLLGISDILSPMIQTLSVISGVILDIGNRVYEFFESTFPNFSSMAGVILGITAAVLGLGVAFSLLTSPISLVVLAVSGIVLAINYVIKKINDMTGATVSATGFIAGTFMQLYSIIYNIIARIWDAFASLVEFFANVWTHPVESVKSLFSNFSAFIFDLAADITTCWDKVATNIANAMTKAINFVISGWNKVIDLIGADLAGKIGLGKANLMNQTTSITGTFRNLANQARQSAINSQPENYFSVSRMKSIDNAYQKGYDFGASLENKISDAAQKFVSNGLVTGLDNSNLASNTADTAKNTGDLNNQLATTAEDLKYLRDIAEKEAINKITTAEIKIDMTNNNAINSSLDIDGVINNLTEKLTEQLDTQVLGVYNY